MNFLSVILQTVLWSTTHCVMVQYNPMQHQKNIVSVSCVSYIAHPWMVIDLCGIRNTFHKHYISFFWQHDSVWQTLLSYIMCIITNFHNDHLFQREYWNIANTIPKCECWMISSLIWFVWSVVMFSFFCSTDTISTKKCYTDENIESN